MRAKALAVFLVAAFAVTLAASARATGPSHAPSRSWYRVTLLIDDSERTDNGETLAVKSLWRIEGNAVNVRAQCRTPRGIVEGTCRAAYNGRVPSHAVDDIEFDASGLAVLDKYRWAWTTRPRYLADGTTCRGRTVSMTTRGATFTASMGGFLAERGLTFHIGPPHAGTMTVDEPAETCTSRKLGSWTRQQSFSGAFPLEDYPAGRPVQSQLAVRAAAKLRVRPGMFGHGFTLSAEETETVGTRTARAKVTLVFTLCTRSDLCR